MFFGIDDAIFNMFGYGEYGKDVCFIWGKVFVRDAPEYFPEVAYNALITISVFSIWRIIFDELIIDGSASRYAERQMSRKGTTTSYAVDKKKYKEQFWKAVTNSILMFFGFYTLYHSPGFWDPSILYTYWRQDMTGYILIYYRLALGYHGHRAIYGLFWEAKRTDWIAYVLHHWTTVFLIIGSWIVGVTELGVIVLALHDSSDVLLSTSKIMGYHNSRVGVLITFPLFTISWVLCRLILFPYKVIYPGLFFKEHRARYDCHPGYWVFPLGGVILLLLHVYWGSLLVNYLYIMITKPMTNEYMHDPRSDDEDDEEEEKDESKVDESKVIIAIGIRKRLTTWTRFFSP